MWPVEVVYLKYKQYYSSHFGSSDALYSCSFNSFCTVSSPPSLFLHTSSLTDVHVQWYCTDPAYGYWLRGGSYLAVCNGERRVQRHWVPANLRGGIPPSHAHINNCQPACLSVLSVCLAGQVHPKFHCHPGEVCDRVKHCVYVCVCVCVCVCVRACARNNYMYMCRYSKNSKSV